MLHPVGQKSCQRGRPGVEVSRRLGVRTRKGKAEGGHNIGTTDQKKVFWLSWVSNLGGSFFLQLGESGHRKEMEIDER